MSTNRLITPQAKKAYQTWMGQRYRCNNKKSNSYSHYGAKGINVEYCSRDFIAWYLQEIKVFKGKHTTCGRIDHSKNYSFDNIEIQTKSENSKERNIRVGNVGVYKKTLVLDVKTKKAVFTARSVTQASIFTGVAASNISAIANGKGQKSAKGYTFKYV